MGAKDDSNPQRTGASAAARHGDSSTADLGEVQLDLDRARRCGYPEAVFADGKSVATLAKIFRRLLAAGQQVLATRVAAEAAAELVAEFPQARHNATARTIRIDPQRSAERSAPPAERRRGRVAILTAGTTDRGVAEEAFETAEWMGAEVVLIQDVGVAGPHRLPARLAEFQDADAIVVVAGMEGALPSVVGGYVSCPVIAVPTSVGYGASFGGIAALLGMLNSCAANVTVVNIDAGFKGGYLAALIGNAKYK
jgi:NCAIR mutase (PurE)-related protein